MLYQFYQATFLDTNVPLCYINFNQVTFLDTNVPLCYINFNQVTFFGHQYAIMLY